MCMYTYIYIYTHTERRVGSRDATRREITARAISSGVNSSEAGMIRMDSLIELKFINLSCSSLSSF